MKALIFNSGLGSRMGEFTLTHHKSMARLGNGETIFARQLRILAANGISDVVVTTGPHATQLEQAAAAPHLAGLTVSFVPNERYDETNYIYSLYLARAHLDDDLLMLHGDLVFNAAVVSRLLADPRPDLGSVNRDLPQPEKDFKARLDGETIREVSVSAFGSDAVAFQPLYKLSRRAAGLWLDRVARFVEDGRTGVYAEDALNEVAEAAAIQAFSYAGDFVAEVDDAADLAAATSQVRLFDFAEQPVLAGPGSHRRIPELLAEAHARRPLVVGGSAYRGSVVAAGLAEASIEAVVFSDYSPNPRLAEVLAGLRRFREHGCDSVISVGGGSAMDVAKCIKLLGSAGSELAGSSGEGGAVFPAFGDPLERHIPHLALPTTAGTGSESTHFAVVYVDGVKHSIAHDAALPDWAVLEPELLAGLPEEHKKASMLDALAQCVESYWAASATDQSREHAELGLRLILDNVFGYFHKAVDFDPATTGRMLRAANLGGRAINLTKTTAAHAMSYGLTARFGTPHGIAAALCLRGIWRLFVHLAATGDPRSPAVAPALDRLAGIFGVATPLEAVEKLDVITEALRVTPPRVSSSADIDELVGSVNAERLGNSPVQLTTFELRAVYEFVLGLRTEPYDLPSEAVTWRASPSACDVHADLEELQALEVEILAAFDEFCRAHGLQYYLSEGSILGAIRHGGFIPWDDDIDVMMPRADYRRFIQLGRDGKLTDGLNLDCFETNPKHWVFGAKLQLTRPTRFVLPKLAALAHFNGPYIEVCPVDAVRHVVGPRFAAQKLMLRGLRRALFMSSGRSRGLRRNPLVRVPLYLATRLLNPPVLHRWITWVQSVFNAGPEATHWANLCSYYPLEREVFPKEWFGTGKRVAFEGLQVPVPERAEDMLARIYGPDYLGVPSLQDRTLRSHSFVAQPAAAPRS